MMVESSLANIPSSYDTVTQYSIAMAMHQIASMTAYKKSLNYEDCIKVSQEFIIFRANLTLNYLYFAECPIAAQH